MDLSIIIPVYNCEKYLEKCLKSIMDEINNNVEVIIVDDGSTDDSEKIYKKYSKIINVKIIQDTNNGVSHARNRGLENSTGRYVMFVDADDYLEKGWFSIIEKYIKLDQEDIIYFSEKKTNNLNKKELIKSIIGINTNSNFSSSCSKLYKNNIIRKNNIKFFESIINGEDLMFNLECVRFSNKYQFVNKSFYCYRTNYFSATHSFNKNFFKSNEIFIKELEKYLKELDFQDSKVRDIINYNIFNSIYISLYKISLHLLHLIHFPTGISTLFSIFLAVGSLFFILSTIIF